jgi:hypothetical protein
VEGEKLLRLASAQHLMQLQQHIQYLFDMLLADIVMRAERCDLSNDTPDLFIDISPLRLELDDRIKERQHCIRVSNLTERHQWLTQRGNRPRGRILAIESWGAHDCVQDVINAKSEDYTASATITPHFLVEACQH